MIGAQSVDHVGSEPPPSVRRCLAGRGHHTGVCEQQHGKVRGDKVGAKGALPLRPLDEQIQAPNCSMSEILGCGRGREPHGDEVLQPSVGGLHGAELVYQPAESGPRVRVLERLFGGSRVVGHLPLEAGRDEVGSGREAPVEGGDAHAGSPGDLLEGRVQAPLGKYLLGCGDYPLTIARGVGPQAR